MACILGVAVASSVTRRSSCSRQLGGNVMMDLLSPSAPGLEHTAVSCQSILGHACRHSPSPSATPVATVSPQSHSYGGKHTKLDIRYSSVFGRRVRCFALACGGESPLSPALSVTLAVQLMHSSWAHRVLTTQHGAVWQGLRLRPQPL